MSEKQTDTRAQRQTLTTCPVSGSTRLRLAIAHCAVLALAAGTGQTLAQTTDLSVPDLTNPLYVPPSASLRGPAGTADPFNDSSAIGSPGGDQGVLHDVRLTRDLPYIAPASQSRTDYNIKLGRATMSFVGSVGVAYTDNALQSTTGGAQDDFTITPSLGILLNIPINRGHGFRINVGIGYRYSLNYSELSSLYIAPSSYIDYQFRIGDVTITLYDQLSSSADDTRRFDLRNQGTTGGVDFSRIGNQSGLSVSYDLSRETSFVAGYSFGLDRGLNDSYRSFDSNTHNFTAAVYHRLSKQLTLGLSTSYNIQEFQNGVYQFNNSSSWSVGPVASYHPTDALNFSAAVRYRSITYESLGTFQVASNPSSIDFDLSAAHKINRYLTHMVTASHAYNNSVSSAQMETFTAGYSLHWLASRKLSVSPAVSWNNFTQKANGLGGSFPTLESFVTAFEGKTGPSGAPLTASDLATYYNLFSFQDKGDYVSASLSATYQLSRHLQSGLSYSYSVRSSSIESKFRPSGINSYSINTVTLNLSYRF